MAAPDAGRAVAPSSGRVRARDASRLPGVLVEHGLAEGLIVLALVGWWAFSRDLPAFTREAATDVVEFGLGNGPAPAGALLRGRLRAGQYRAEEKQCRKRHDHCRAIRHRAHSAPARDAIESSGLSARAGMHVAHRFAHGPPPLGQAFCPDYSSCRFRTSPAAFISHAAHGTAPRRSLHPRTGCRLRPADRTRPNASRQFHRMTGGCRNAALLRP